MPGFDRRGMQAMLAAGDDHSQQPLAEEATSGGRGSLSLDYLKELGLNNPDIAGAQLNLPLNLPPHNSDLSSSTAINASASHGYILPPDYLRASYDANRSQPFCGNPEGWGPLSPYRYDFTPCFLDVWIAAVAVLFGIVMGSGALYYLFNKKSPVPVPKNWHFYAKLSTVAALGATTALQACLQIEAMPGVWFRDFRFWTTIVTMLSLGVIWMVHYHEHWRSRQPNGVVLFYWLLMNVAYIVKLRSLVSQELFKNRLPYFIVFCISTALALLAFILEYFIPKKKSAYEALGDEDECPIEYADIFSILTFSWMTPLMKFGYTNFLTQDDLWNLRKRDTCEVTGEALREAWEAQLRKKNPSLWVAMFTAFGGPYARGAIIKSFSDILQFVQPQLLRVLINWVESQSSPNPQPNIRGIAIALSMFVVSVVQTSCLHQYFQRAYETGMRIRAALTVMIYDKSLKLSNEGRSDKATGDIVNYMAVDTMRLQDLTQYGQQLWSAPFQITLCMVSLYQLLGYSMFAGVGIMVLSIPLNGFIVNFQKKFQKRQMKNKDARTRLMTEILNNMRSIKLFAWGRAFMDKLNYIRNDLELNTLRKIGALSAVQNFTWASVPIFVSASTFGVFVVTSNRPLTTDLVFPALTLFNLLSFPLMVLPMVITAIVEATVAVGRLNAFFIADEIQPDAVTRHEAATHAGDETVRIRDGSFTWDRYKPSAGGLKGINFRANKGELSCVVGRVGSGKSTFLEAILGNVYKTEGEVVVHGNVAYVAQQPWVMNASVRENITFGYRWDQAFYDKTVKACALLDDFKTLPDGDKTEVGERGISLSGGQKARLTLARAVYARADVYLLDDVLSAVDQHVGRHIINNVLGPQGLLASRTRILATNAIPVLDVADYISLIREKTIIEHGTYQQLMAMRGEVANLIKAANNDSGSSTPSQEPGSPAASDAKLTQYSSDEEEDEARESVASLGLTRTATTTATGSGSPATRKDSVVTLRRASTASFKQPHGRILDDETGDAKTKQQEETMEQGKVKWEVYGEYAKANNLTAVCVYLFCLMGGQTLIVGSNLWLKHWSEENQRLGASANIGKNIAIYSGLGLGGSALMVVQMLVLWIFCSIEASRKIHERMAHAIFRAPMMFFETNPLGRIVNRFSRDIYKIDEVLARTFNMLFANAARAAYTLVLVTASTPVFALLIPPIGWLYMYIQGYYLRTSRELKRLESVSNSPIFAHFQESLGGLTTIRAYRQQRRFKQENEWRLDGNLKSFFPSISANRWHAIRLEFIGSLIIFAAALFAVVSIMLGSGPSAGWLGLAMSYSLQVTGSLNWIVRQTVEVETNIVSVERCLEYANLPSERPEILSKHRPKISWPSRGAVEFNGYSTRYRPGLDLVLKDVNLSIKGHEKVGVVGRTGAGKSSLTMALFRIIEAAGGSIVIDGLDTGSIGLLDLRRRLAIIPQDAALFEGSVRDNLDPAHTRDDTELWDALAHARLREHVANMEGQLDARIQEGGSNLSQGQRQLVSLARALLTPTSILVLDEATAAVDIETDSLLQSMLRGPQFKDRTIITIAHRINTILDSDRIVVLDRGTVKEFDTPAELIKSKGLFYELVREANLLETFNHQQGGGS